MLRTALQITLIHGTTKEMLYQDSGDNAKKISHLRTWEEWELIMLHARMLPYVTRLPSTLFLQKAQFCGKKHTSREGHFNRTIREDVDYSEH
ncbi:unnamed protein product [Lasius platythorax]|uniref:Uncharacterized protein n=1 Tax=Lasius platythorax TaxID=488582 RepID=A0AAV2NEY6_9HYME